MGIINFGGTNKSRARLAALDKSQAVIAGLFQSADDFRTAVIAFERKE